jgi:hypothetical protein
MAVNQAGNRTAGWGNQKCKTIYTAAGYDILHDAYMYMCAIILNIDSMDFIFEKDGEKRYESRVQLLHIKSWFILNS